MKPGETFIDDTTFPTPHLIEAAQEIEFCKGCCYGGKCHEARECKDVVFKGKGPLKEPKEEQVRTDDVSKIIQTSTPYKVGKDIYEKMFVECKFPDEQELQKNTAVSDNHICRCLTNTMNLRFIEKPNGSRILQQEAHCIECWKSVWRNIPLVEESSTRDQE